MAIKSAHLRNSSKQTERRQLFARDNERQNHSRRRLLDEQNESPKPHVSTMLILIQSGVCVVALLFAFMMRISQSETYLKAREWYIQASTTPSNFENPIAWVMGGGLERLRGQITEVFSNKTDVPQSSGEDSSQQGSESQPGEAQLVTSPSSESSSSQQQSDKPKDESSSSSQSSSSQSQSASQSKSESQSQSASKSKDASQSQSQSSKPQAKASGASGGWWPWSPKEKDEKSAIQAVPAGCWAGPVFLTAPAANPAYGKLTCEFGQRTHPITGEPDFHRGIDIAAPQGSGVYAAWPGTVAEVGFSNIYGNYIKIDHSPKLSTMYSHCYEILAKPGINVRAKDRIALVGSTGISTGSHVHFDLIVGGLFADPMYAFDFDEYGI